MSANLKPPLEFIDLLKEHRFKTQAEAMRAFSDLLIDVVCKRSNP